MGIGPATIKSKSELVQPSKRIGYLYNVGPGGLFPKEQAHSSSAAGRSVASRNLRVAKNRGNRAGEAPFFFHPAAREAATGALLRRPNPDPGGTLG